MQIIERNLIEQKLNLPKIFQALKQGFIDFSAGLVTVPPVGHLGFDNPPGDCHIKYGWIKGDPHFVVKISSGFYENPKQGLPSSTGMMLVFSATTGQPVALLNDGGLLTDVRTALAGVLATETLSRPDSRVAAIVGTGIQARLLAEYLDELSRFDRFVIWGRNEENLNRCVQDLLAKGLNVVAEPDLQQLCAKADSILTVTPSEIPLLKTDWIRPGTHITAIGADAEGKQELDSEIFARAQQIIVDSRAQCCHHGEISHAYKAGLISADRITELGTFLSSDKPFVREPAAITIADLTGVAVQDIVIAKSVYQAITQQAVR
ncbi:ornithine cyclodeaminase family protein [Kiloniella laminariae]|uniref:Ornithine cyclodeaminase family protein n=1 Tax=Kiloniella laminariae TaxID=454162 RepID=A0ABT4LQZ5_9PROT|nr:ornithine cyclodeaminase family protein [Kiloniella laminariae]MCZ4282751.1 ornithine cyclodeaminase family protein [Kiloniella laminariae]